jgi:hypothetical protein
MKVFLIGLFPPTRNKVVIYQMATGGGKEKKAKGGSKGKKGVPAGTRKAGEMSTTPVL